jgi:hypothetical protein
MIHQMVASDGAVSQEFRRLFKQLLVRTAPGAVALAVSALAGAWILHGLPAAPPKVVRAPSPPVAAPTPATVVVANPYGGLFDPGFFPGSSRFLPAQRPADAANPPLPPIRLAEAPEPGDVAPGPLVAPPGATAPLPPPRPAAIATPASPPAVVRRFAATGRAGAAAPDNRNFFEKLFGLDKPAGPMLAYASPEDGVSTMARSEATGPSARYDRWTAVYDVAAHTVYLPDGTRLEAHSGLGDRLDDPAHVDERNRGATPPHVYELEPREQLFHGVQALRLTPIGGGDIFGRAGLLAHSYMLGPNGDSNGCVSFKNYEAFLQAFQSGQIKRLAVVARLS